MINYTPEGLITDDPVVASLFLDRVVGFDEDGSLFWATLESVDNGGATVYLNNNAMHRRYPTEILIPYSEIKRKIEPVEGEGWVYDPKDIYEKLDLVVFENYQTEGQVPEECYHKRVLLFVDTRAELRELVQRIEEAQNGRD